MAKKHWSVLLGLSVAVGVASSLFLKNEKEKSQTELTQLKSLYAGNWRFVDHKHKVQHNLEINSDLEMTLDGRQFKQEIIELTSEKLVLQDEYGYLLVFSQNQPSSINFYDEANDQTYHLETRKN